MAILAHKIRIYPTDEDIVNFKKCLVKTLKKESNLYCSLLFLGLLYRHIVNAKAVKTDFR